LLCNAPHFETWLLFLVFIYRFIEQWFDASVLVSVIVINQLFPAVVIQLTGMSFKLHHWMKQVSIGLEKPAKDTEKLEEAGGRQKPPIFRLSFRGTGKVPQC